MIRELLDEFPILGWRTYLLTCMTDDISEKKNPAAMNMTGYPREVYYYGMPGVDHDQDLFSTKFPNIKGTFLTHSLRNLLKDSSWYMLKQNSMAVDPNGQDQIVNLINNCRAENK